MRRRAAVLLLHAVKRLDRLRLWLRVRRQPGLELDPSASTNLASARFTLAPGARLVIGPGVVTERRAGALHFFLEPGAVVEIGAGTWLRTELEPVRIFAFEGARLAIGPECLLSGCHVSAKRSVAIGRRVWVGPGARVFDSHQHDMDAERPERPEPVAIDDFAWIAADTTVLQGVRIGAHSIVGTRSVVTRDVPPHTLVVGAPAREQGKVGDRSRCA